MSENKGRKVELKGSFKQMAKGRAHIANAPELPQPDQDKVTSRKRTATIALVALGVGAVGVYGMSRTPNRCDSIVDPVAKEQCQRQNSSRSSSGSSHWSSWSSSSSNQTPTQHSTNTKSSSNNLFGSHSSSGGFGKTGAHFSGHSSGG